MIPLRARLAGRENHRAGKNGQGKNVGEDHQLIAEVLQFPDKIIFQDSPGKNGKNGKNRIDGKIFPLEKPAEVDFPEVVPA